MRDVHMSHIRVIGIYQNEQREVYAKRLMIELNEFRYNITVRFQKGEWRADSMKHYSNSICPLCGERSHLAYCRISTRDVHNLFLEAIESKSFRLFALFEF